MSVIEKELFSSLVKRPSAISPELIPQLEATIKAFPYCQISYSLLAKASSIAGADKFDEARPKAAAYALSRVALQQLVENDTDRYDESAALAPVQEATDDIPQSGEDILISLVDQELTNAQALRSEEQRLQQQIIQGFMKRNPRIVRQDNNLEPISLDLSGRLADETETSIETEAFARILVRQGKIEKAIDVYQKLILKKPEKRNYFAKKLSELYKTRN